MWTHACEGLILPLTVPQFWGRYPDQIADDEERFRIEQANRDALKRAGMTVLSASTAALSFSNTFLYSYAVHAKSSTLIEHLRSSQMIEDYRVGYG